MILCLSVHYFVDAVLQFEEEIARKKTVEPAMSSKDSECPIIPSVNALSSERSEGLHCFDSVSTCRSVSPVVVVSQPAVVSSHPPVHMLRVVPRVLDTVGRAVRPPSTDTVACTLSSRHPLTAVAPSSLVSRFRPPVTGFQAAFNRVTFPTTAGPSLHQLLAPSASTTIHPTRMRLPFSSSSPNLAAAGAGSKHVLVDNTGQVISTVLPPAGSALRLDDGKLKKNSSVASGISSVSAIN